MPVTGAAPPLTVAVLAGGRGRRFGGDKLAARIGDRSVLARTIDRVTPLGPVVVVGDRLLPADCRGRPALPDAAPPHRPAPGRPGRVRTVDAPDLTGGQQTAGDDGLGPLAGIVAALEAARTPLIAVVAGDMPHADPNLLQALAADWHDEVAVVPVGASGPQPLHAVWATGHTDAVRSAFDAGQRSPLALLRRLDCRLVPVDDRGGWADDVDTHEDLAALAQRVRYPDRGPAGPGRP